MFPFSGVPIPESAESLVAGLESGLAARGWPAREVIASGPWPALDLLRIDLTGVEISQPTIPALAERATGLGFTAARFELLAAPATIEAAPVQIHLEAMDAAFDLAPITDGGSVVLIQRAAQGEVAVEVTRADLERQVFRHASAAAAEHGAEVKRVNVTFESRSPRAVSIRAEVTAKMFIASATITLCGDLDINDQLEARLSNLHLEGSGMVANLAGGFLRPHLAKLEGKSYPLMSVSLGAIKLRDIQFKTGDALRLTAQFGS